MTPWDEVLRRHEHEREVIMRWEERADETETVHQFAFGAGEGASGAASLSGEQSEQSRATSRATSPDFYIDKWEHLFQFCVRAVLTLVFCSASESSYAVESLSSGPSSEHPDSPLSAVDFNWDLMDDDIADIPEGVL